ncbi:hypothetical protein GCM10018952_05430 [Streptosporangium vulgare]
MVERVEATPGELTASRTRGRPPISPRWTWSAWWCGRRSVTRVTRCSRRDRPRRRSRRPERATSRSPDAESGSEPGSESRSDAESGSESGPREAEAPRGRREGA